MHGNILAVAAATAFGGLFFAVGHAAFAALVRRLIRR